MRGRLSTESRCYPRWLRIRATGAARCNGDLCTAEKHLVKYCRRNVIFGLIRERITGLVRIKHFRGPLGTFSRRYVPVKEIRVERPAGTGVQASQDNRTAGLL